MKIVYHGHSFVEIETYGKSILIDPFINGNSGCEVTFDEVIEKSIDAIVLTHGHDDHVGEAVEIAQVTGAMVICNFELGQYLTREKGVDNVSLQGIGGGVQYDDFHVKFFQSWHGGGITSLSHGYTTVACGVIVSLEGKVVYHAGDTGLFGDMKLLHELYEVDVAFLPIGDRFTMGVKDASIATSWIQPKVVVPIHYDTWDVIAADTEAFVWAVGERAPGTNVEVMKGGDEIEM